MKYAQFYIIIILFLSLKSMLFTALGKSVADEISERRLVRMSNFSPSLNVIFDPTSNFVGTTPVTTIRFSFSAPFKISRIFPFLSMQIYLYLIVPLQYTGYDDLLYDEFRFCMIIGFYCLQYLVDLFYPIFFVAGRA